MKEITVSMPHDARVRVWYGPDNLKKIPAEFRLVTYRIANLRGFSESTGNRKKQITKQTAAPRLHAEKMSIRSQRLTIEDKISFQRTRQKRNCQRIKPKKEIGRAQATGALGTRSTAV
jgi:hypothetical protein